GARGRRPARRPPRPRALGGRRAGARSARRTARALRAGAAATGEMGEPRRCVRRRLVARRLRPLPALRQLPRELQVTGREPDLTARADDVPVRLVDRVPRRRANRRAAAKTAPDVDYRVVSTFPVTRLRRLRRTGALRS